MQISDSLTARTVSIGGNCGTCRTDLLSTELQEPKSLWVRPYAPMPSTCSTTRSSTPGSAYSSPLPTRTTAISTTRDSSLLVVIQGGTDALRLRCILKPKAFLQALVGRPAFLIFSRARFEIFGTGE